ncbi:MAG TPA: hypothetical protein VMH81_23640 [Bryobacteraceae bacterium]|nr:hypothetical protein [Bryobacteraceae bacterium]
MQLETPLPLTLEEHRELARELRASNARLRELCQLVVSVYGPNNQAAFTFLKAAEAVERLCNDMQAQAAADYPGYPIGSLYV